MPDPALTKGPLDRAVSCLRVSEAPPHTPSKQPVASESVSCRSAIKGGAEGDGPAQHFPRCCDLIH